MYSMLDDSVVSPTLLELGQSLHVQLYTISKWVRKNKSLLNKTKCITSGICQLAVSLPVDGAGAAGGGGRPRLSSLR